MRARVADSESALRIEPVTGAVTAVGALSAWRNKWQGGVQVGDDIYCVPCDAPQVRLARQYSLR